MYLQLTTRCNMTCAHCCFSATNKGIDMDRETFVAALNLVYPDEYLTLGGGEPTCHKEFFTYLDFALSRHDGEILVITNGKLAGKATKLLDYAERYSDRLQVMLSQDRYHDAIRPEIVRAFRVNASIRTFSRLLPVGRGKELLGVAPEDTVAASECCCSDPLIDPSGNVYSCGCKTHLLGTVFDSEVLSNYDREFAHTGGRDPDQFSDELIQAAA